MSGPAPSEPRATTDPAVLDELAFDELHQSLASQPDALAGVYRKFLQAALTTIDGLSSQAPAARISTVHTLKGSAAMLGALRLAAVAAQIQEQLGSAQAPTIEEATRRLSEELDAFRLRVNSRFAALGQPAP